MNMDHSNFLENMTDEDRTALLMFLLYSKNELITMAEQLSKEAEEAGMTLPDYLESTSSFKNNYKCKCAESEKMVAIDNRLKDLSERVENIEKQMKEDKEEQLKRLKAEVDYAKFRCTL